MPFLLASAVKDLRRRARDPLSLLLWVAIPLVTGLLLDLAFGSEGSGPSAHLLVADRDDSLVSGLLVGAFSQGELGELTRVEEVDAPAGRRRIEAGDASALLVIPPGFGADALAGRTSTLTLIRNPAQQILPDILEESLGLMLEAAFYLRQLARAPIALFSTAGLPSGAATYPDSTVASGAVTINELVARVQPYLFPPVIGLETAEPEPDARAERGFAELFFPGMVFLALLFMARGMSEDVWRERAQGTLRRAVVSPRGLGEFLGGKLLAGAVLLAVVGVAALLAGRFLFGLDLRGVALAVLWITFAGTAMLALFVLVQLHATSERAGDVLTTAVLFPLAMAGGSFFPFDVMPGWMAAIGRRTPNGWALDELSRILSGQSDLAGLAAAFAGVLAVAVAAFLLALRRLRSGFATGG
ncbi:MAG: ABC transporter permease [Gemmatimonadetes bacterium]|nr:ABC transporter permease [Gemmatimonadota bacterium]